MKVPQMIAAELRRLTSTRMALIALIALVAVPVIYGGLYLWANQDPYGNLDEVPVALVVSDTGSDDGGRNIGDEVADGLIDDGTFDWHEVSAAQASSGVDDGTYDFSVTFPEEFTTDLTSASTDAPHQAQVVLSTNDANSYLATTIGEQATKTIQAQIVKQVGHESAVTFLDSLSEIRGKLSTAADGASDLTDAAGQLTTGAGSLHDGATQLADGASQLADGTAALSTGAASLADGAEQASAGAASAASSAAQLAAGAAQVSAGNAQIANVADSASAQLAAAQAQVPAVRADLQSRLQAAGADQATIDAALAAFDSMSTKLDAGSATLNEAAGKIDTLAAGSAQVASGSSQLSSGLNTLATGTKSVSDGSAQLATGAATAAGGASSLRDGSTQLVDGSAQLADGLGVLDDGAAELRDGLVSGRDAIPDTDEATRGKQADTIADPVSLETSSVTSAGTYGAGLAPFFTALAAWIGIYALFLIVKPISRRAVTAIRKPFRVTLAGWLTPTILGAVQMAGLYSILAFALGFQIANPVGMFGIMLLSSAAFAAIVLALNVWLGSVGQFLGLVLMVLQLVTAGGTFPWQTLPGPLAALHHVLPMGFAVDALRQAMYGGNPASAVHDVIVLGLWLVIALLLAAIGVTRMTHHRTLRDLQPSLIG